MRYYLANNTLIVRGAFRACSTGEGGGIGNVTSLLIHPVDPLNPPDNKQVIRNAKLRNGLSPAAAFGLLIPTQFTQHAVFRYEQVTVFITAGANTRGISRQEKYDTTDPLTEGSIRIICTISGNLPDHDLLKALIAVNEAAVQASSGDDRISGLDQRGIIIGAEPDLTTRGDTNVNVERNIREAVRYGITYTIERLSKGSGKTGIWPSFHIHSTMGGDRWIEWQKKGCPYYPCHFKGQRCDLCYCPLYPCEDETLGEWTIGSRGRVWSCVPCTLNHQPSVVHHLQRNPEATSSELKALILHYPHKEKPGE